MKIETHVHCKEMSPCGRSSYVDVVNKYKELGYDAMIMTDHYARYNADEKANIGIGDFFAYYDEIYHKAKELGEKVGITVLKGYELRLDGYINDYLVYGIPDEIAKDYKNLFSMSIKEVGKLSREAGFLLYQAHPFRNDIRIVKPDYLYGIEVYNGHPGHDSRNDIAEMWAEKYNLHKTSGSDCHHIDESGHGGVITERKIKTIEDFVDMMKNDDYTLYKNGAR